MSIFVRHARNLRARRFALRLRRPRRRTAIALAALVLLVAGIGYMAWSPASVLNAIARWGAYRATIDIAYAPGPRHALDVYAPEQRGETAPVAVFFYGGNWQEGDKATYRFVGAALASRGIVTVIPDYRVYPEVRFPGFLEDAAKAVRWAHDHAAQFGGDPNRLVLIGHSAGAYIAAMLTYDRRLLAADGLDPDRDVKGFVGLAGPYDFLPLHSATLKIIFGPEPGLAATQPINYVEPGAPPAFLASGRSDDMVDPGNVTRIARRIAEKGAAATTQFYDGVGHRMLIGAFAAPLRRLAPVLPDTVAFVRGVTGASPVPGAPPR